jgi:outer membrane protein OmpA-like peptidoglycan-associated protein
MKKIVLLLFIFLSMMSFSVLAQGERDSGKDVDEMFGKEKSKYWNNWFISAGGSANILMGEQDKEASLSERYKLGYDVAIGKWFNSTVGIRFQAMGGGLKGYADIHHHGGEYTRANDGQRSPYPKGFIDNLKKYGIEGNDEYLSGYKYIPEFWRGFKFANKEKVMISRAVYEQLAASTNPKANELAEKYKGNIDPGGNEQGVFAYYQEFKYSTYSLDFMINLSTLFRGYHKEGNLFDIIPFVGLGYIHADESLSNPDFYYGVATLGGRLNVNITKNISVYAEAQASVTSREFDGYIGEELINGVLNVSAGLQLMVNRDFSSPSTAYLSPDEINYLNEKINANRSLLEKHQGMLDRHQDLLDKLNDCCDERSINSNGFSNGEVVTQIITSRYLPEYVRFTLNSAKIQLSEESKLRDAVEFLKANPQSKLLLVGYADKYTGTSSYNFELSRKRVQAISEELIRRGIDAKRLILEWKGDKEQPYGPNDWNRVVIMVER